MRINYFTQKQCVGKLQNIFVMDVISSRHLVFILNLNLETDLPFPQKLEICTQSLRSLGSNHLQFYFLLILFSYFCSEMVILLL